MMELCKTLEELHVELEGLPPKQHRAHDELSLDAAMRTWWSR